MLIPNSDSKPYRVELLNVSKSFREVRALSNVSFNVRPGEIHALVGENGAGKSTLMKILSGVHRLDRGTIKLDGELVEIPSPHAGRQLGIGIIYQELALVPDLTVAENILINRLSRRFGMVNWRDLNHRASELLAETGFPKIDPRSRVGDLGVAYGQIVEIAKGISENVRVLILDEPTAVLAPQEVTHLFAALAKLRERGIGLVYISHRLDEIFRIADRITVLKDGAVVQTVLPSEIGQQELIGLMIGRTLGTMFPRRTCAIGAEMLRVENLCSDRIKDVSFSVRAGEVFGISGLVGSGRTELLRAVFGADPKEQGTVAVAGRQTRIASPGDAVRNGIALVPESRKDHGLIISMAVRHNITLPSIGRMSRPFGILRRQAETRVAEGLVSRLRIKTQSIEDEVADLSGGNQQKVVLAKWLSAGCSILLLDEPTRGVDVGARVEIYGLINELAAAGMAIVVVSSDMLEVIGLCDRVAVMSNGRLTGTLAGGDITEESILRLAIQRTAQGGA